jgi:hypothetical protein
MKVVDFDGAILDATFCVVAPERGVISLNYESSGGSNRELSHRNHHYRQGLNVLFKRLQSVNAVISEIRIETGTARSLPVEKQRIVIPNRPFPVVLAAVANLDEFRQEISRYGREVGQAAVRSSKGGSSRRLRIFLIGVQKDQAALESQLVGRGVEANGRAVATVVSMAAGRYCRGQGFLVSQAVREIIEEYAVAWAIRHYEAQGWIVHDVGATESFDLRCTRDGIAERHVEVKGTTGIGEAVILTRNEVVHAREWHPSVDLFIVTEIRVEALDSDTPTACDGRARICHNWQPAEDSLTSVGYEYLTGLDNTLTINMWKPVE